MPAPSAPTVRLLVLKFQMLITQNIKIGMLKMDLVSDHLWKTPGCTTISWSHSWDSIQAVTYGKFTGFVSHYHVSKKKIDCAGLDIKTLLEEVTEEDRTGYITAGDVCDD